ncbi:ATP synthase subunit d, mitochondrial-like [Gopherus evgoodei]|uniref:ATP synthase subunit d, mitochondrial-like n=1 Tax=Gopherus evgoodei TaxID=1825980 RepID=UPI0011CFF169|nr:ATP synthase subunit d, mitochondrial-like [Gopherus evgoodei]
MVGGGGNGLTSLAEKPPSPAIDWVNYKTAVAKAGMVDEFERKLEKFRTMIPFDQMTFEDLNKVFPETKLDKEKYPYWPHRPIEDL